MRRTDYESLASGYDRRYDLEDYAGTTAALLSFVGDEPCDVLEVGCGTGHWLEVLAQAGHRARGVDASEAMLAQARARLDGVDLQLGSAERLPCERSAVDRLVCIHAFHHFQDKAGFLREALRVLRPEGQLLIAGLDPHSPDVQWAVYDYWPQTRKLDLERYPTIDGVVEMMREAGFARAECHLVERLDATRDAAEALATGRLDKELTSQLAMLTDDEYAEGRARLEREIEQARAAGRTLQARARLELWAATAKARA